MTPIAHILEAERIRFAYQPDTRVVSDVNLSVSPGEMLGIIGPNGSGKSTLIQCLLGSLAAQGDVRWKGRPLRAWSRRDLARLVAYLAQNPVYDESLRVIDMVRAGRTPYQAMFGIESSGDGARVEALLDEMQLAELARRRLWQLSGGQRQRVLLARALAQEPSALLLDEPNTFLDLHYQIELLRKLRQLADEQGLAVVMASHDLNLTGAYCDRVMLLEGGEVAAFGPPKEVLTAALISRVYRTPMQLLRADPPTLVPVI